MSLMYKVCKRIILRGNVEESFATKILAFKNANIISEEEYNELSELLNS